MDNKKNEGNFYRKSLIPCELTINITDDRSNDYITAMCAEN